MNGDLNLQPPVFFFCCSRLNSPIVLISPVLSSHSVSMLLSLYLLYLYLTTHCLLCSYSSLTYTPPKNRMYCSSSLSHPIFTIAVPSPPGSGPHIQQSIPIESSLPPFPKSNHPHQQSRRNGQQSLSPRSPLRRRDRLPSTTMGPQTQPPCLGPQSSRASAPRMGTIKETPSRTPRKRAASRTERSWISADAGAGR